MARRGRQLAPACGATSLSWGVAECATWRKGSNIVSKRRTSTGRRMPWCSQAEPTEQLAQQYFRPAMMCSGDV